ncbi:TerC family protein [Chenggangzhangella methanolivorans]|uniref:TerC family protein n=1 Tax=Chenggangzhangella methanolivorans TaxID=1437009 RepID=A0A9E6RA32_9HYPH|nr:TerC family protein [Chenggangzhangella methanolivorans]QZN99427.1 TerC family protein [Chenggangzhangella methanolivorans]
MLELLQSPEAWAALLTLTAMEIVLGIDNVVFISVLVAKLPPEQAEKARKLGLALALVFRIALLFMLSWLIALKDPVIEIFGKGLSWRDIILIAGGGFLLVKATLELHNSIEGEEHGQEGGAVQKAFMVIIAQIIVIDLVFSIDSIITAIGMAEDIEVMIAAVVIAVAVMYVSSGPISAFVAKHPTTKVLALSFLLLIGMVLVADGFGFHVPKAYIYAAMAFSLMVEIFNVMAKSRQAKKKGALGVEGVPAKPAERTTH